ncbi:hypothetical protein [Aurantimonas coralicida]|uniref:hypothetical protein n=1 Tax=Aurantimonas coralicida TaxID=182270 RepID=UPI001D18AA40|nr:hypothetical protein [Aurantimonas coralicida]MCC4297408.1 hypothetical protein [Aurantimonas coralicida]MDE0923703.1 hypothetical protein [Aurantimonas coralicida]
MLATTLALLSFGLTQPVIAPGPVPIPSGIAASVAPASAAPAGEPAEAFRLVQHRGDGRHHRRGGDRRGRDGIDRGSLDADRYLYDFRDAPRWRTEERARHDGRGRDGRRDDGRRDGDRHHDRDRHDRDHRDRDDRHRADHRDRDEDRRDWGSDGDWDYGRGFDNDRTRDDQRGDSRFRERRERFEERRKRW